MALIKRGSFGDFSAVATGPTAKVAGVAELDYVSILTEATRDAQPVSVDFTTSGDRRGLGLHSLKLTRGFEGILGDLFNKKNEVYFLAWAWDLSGKPPHLYPGAIAGPEKCLIPMKAGEVREFLGQGALLFPARKISAGLAVRLQIWECDQGARDFGKTLSEVAAEIEGSELTNLLTLIAASTGAALATVVMIEKASLELAKLVGTILKANSDNYVDFYEGYYSAGEEWSSGEESHKGHASEIVLTRMK